MASANPANVYARLQLSFDTELHKMLERAARDIRMRVARLKPGVGGEVRAAQLRLVLGEIRNVQQQMWTQGVLPTIARGQKAAAKAAEDAVETLDRVLYATLPERAAETVRDGLRATALAGIERDRARVPRELSQRVYHDFALTSGQVEKTIRSGLISGLSARELAQDVYHLVSPTVPGGVSYAAMRLARTEINNSFHEQQIAGGLRPGVTGVQWNLSGSHRKPDLCNQYASANPDELGRGVYKANNVPSKPHPNCLCFLTYETLDAKQFEQELKKGKFDNELDRRIQENLERLGAPPVKSARKPSSPSASRKGLQASIKTGRAVTAPLGGGQMSRTELVTFKDGRKAVRKKDLGYARDADVSQDAEELASLYGQSIGIHTPEVVRASKDSIYVDWVDGEFIQDRIGFFFGDDNPELRRLIDTAEGRRLGLFDAVIMNVDRNAGNWLIGKDGELFAIDHGSSFMRSTGSVAEQFNWITAPTNVMAKSVFGSTEGLEGSFAYTKADVQFMRDKLTAMREEFERRGHLDWYDDALARLKYIERKAKGRTGVFT